MASIHFSTTQLNREVVIAVKLHKSQPLAGSNFGSSEDAWRRSNNRWFMQQAASGLNKRSRCFSLWQWKCGTMIMSLSQVCSEIRILAETTQWACSVKSAMHNNCAAPIKSALNKRSGCILSKLISINPVGSWTVVLKVAECNFPKNRDAPI